ncbi:MAG TPA: hypothetical protein VFH91_06305 [Pyrinomonadaceae bacterium]|nr:hypothetical protein [Pyrinomonadaceae bacterium]
MTEPSRILLQTTIPDVEDDWHVGRFSLLRQHLSSLKDDQGNSLFVVAARNRQTNADGNDEVLSQLDKSDFDQLWIFAVDTGNGLTIADCEGITRFRQRGGGILSMRDHQDLGSSLCTIGGIGRAHYFHSKQQEPDESRRSRDDQATAQITWPNYHSGNNGDYQLITTVEPVHELLRRGDGEVIKYFPAHPHEGAVGVPADESNARVIATGESQTTHRPFNLVVAFEKASDSHGNELGRAIAESSFHHFVDYNWDISMGCPSFLVETPGHQIQNEPEKLSDIKTYVRNLALWLTPQRN